MDINQIFGEDYFPQLDNDFLRLFKDKKKSDNCIKRKVSFDDNITDIKVSYKYIIESYYDVLKNIDKHSNIEYNNNSYIISNILYNFTSQSNKRKLEDNYEIYDNYLVKRCKTINNFYNNNKRKLEDTYENYDNYMGKRCN